MVLGGIPMGVGLGQEERGTHHSFNTRRDQEIKAGWLQVEVCCRDSVTVRELQRSATKQCTGVTGA